MSVYFPRIQDILQIYRHILWLLPISKHISGPLSPKPTKRKDLTFGWYLGLTAHSSRKDKAHEQGYEIDLWTLSSQKSH